MSKMKYRHAFTEAAKSNPEKVADALERSVEQSTLDEVERLAITPDEDLPTDETNDATPETDAVADEMDSDDADADETEAVDGDGEETAPFDEPASEPAKPKKKTKARR